MKSRSVVWSFNYAIEGMIYALRTQRNMRIHVVIALLVIVAAMILQVDKLALLALAFAISIVFITELINTAIEATVDLSTEAYDPLAKIAKDVAAGAVMVASITAVAVAYLTMFDPLRAVAQRGFATVRIASPTLTVGAIGIIMLVVVILKAATRAGTYLHGGWPSGHTALAFGAATALGYITGSASAFLLACFIAALVAQSRVESEAHTVVQVISGGMLGVLIVTAVFQVLFV